MLAPMPSTDPRQVHGSAAPAVGDEPLSIAVDIPWDSYLGAGARDRLADGSLRAQRDAYPAAAAADVLDCATVTGQLLGDAGAHERLAAIAVGVASARHRPVRLPHRPGDEPHAWWIAEEKTLVWLAWADIDEEPYGMGLLASGEADAVVVLAPDAIWTIFDGGIPACGSAGRWQALPTRLRNALVGRGLGDGERASLQWDRPLGSDHVTLRWRDASGDPRQAVIEVNRQDR